ncbi:DUF924 family protein [Pseudogemmobacter sp. W21_MBD1_M6]|uniref:DUF924 family protein n=1 Tax=Pseudogemmobacter sp. W21_MBD1_M6 TaxID=3240271 RepID=UPI003F99BCD8
MLNPEAVLDYWINEVGPKGWYAGGEALDAQVKEKFEDAWHTARKSGFKTWMADPRGTLALVILLDQFPRNMFRGTADAFASDNQARATAKTAIERNWDLKVPEPERQFFYLPLMHSECLTDQERSVRLFKTRMPETGTSNLLHARAHREVIRRFGRFPTRNEALHRPLSTPESAYLASGGYGAVVQSIEA